MVEASGIGRSETRSLVQVEAHSENRKKVSRSLDDPRSAFHVDPTKQKKRRAFFYFVKFPFEFYASDQSPTFHFYPFQKIRTFY
jgi:hypothetical protein